MRYTQLLYERVQNFKSLALMKVKIEKQWSFTQSHTNLSYLGPVSPNFRNKH